MKPIWLILAVMLMVAFAGNENDTKPFPTKRRNSLPKVDDPLFIKVTGRGVNHRLSSKGSWPLLNNLTQEHHIVEVAVATLTQTPNIQKVEARVQQHSIRITALIIEKLLKAQKRALENQITNIIKDIKNIMTFLKEHFSHLVLLLIRLLKFLKQLLRKANQLSSAIQSVPIDYQHQQLFNTISKIQTNRATNFTGYLKLSKIDIAVKAQNLQMDIQNLNIRYLIGRHHHSQSSLMVQYIEPLKANLVQLSSEIKKKQQQSRKQQKAALIILQRADRMLNKLQDQILLQAQLQQQERIQQQKRILKLARLQQKKIQDQQRIQFLIKNAIKKGRSYGSEQQPITHHNESTRKKSSLIRSKSSSVAAQFKVRSLPVRASSFKDSMKRMSEGFKSSLLSVQRSLPGSKQRLTTSSSSSRQDSPHRRALSFTRKHHRRQDSKSPQKGDRQQRSFSPKRSFSLRSYSLGRSQISSPAAMRLAQYKTDSKYQSMQSLGATGYSPHGSQKSKSQASEQQLDNLRKEQQIKRKNRAQQRKFLRMQASQQLYTRQQQRQRERQQRQQRGQLSPGKFQSENFFKTWNQGQHIQEESENNTSSSQDDQSFYIKGFKPSSHPQSDKQQEQHPKDKTKKRTKYQN